MEVWGKFDAEMKNGVPLQSFTRGGGALIQWEEAFALRPSKDTIIEVWRGVEPNHTLLVRQFVVFVFLLFGKVIVHIIGG